MAPVQPLGASQSAPQVPVAPAKKGVSRDFIKTLVIVGLGLLVVGLLILFIWMTVRYLSVRDDVDGQIAMAVAEAKEKQAMEYEELFNEREKDPYKTFSGPEDYGQVTFEYPKTWSVYIASGAASGGNYEAYMNPVEVYAPSTTTVNALRLAIRNAAFETVAAEYQRAMEKKDANLSMETVEVAGVTANRYSGKIPGTDMIGIIVIFKIRDKTAVFRTDSVLFAEDFDRLISTVSFNM